MKVEWEIKGICGSLKHVPDGARVTRINGVEVVAKCEMCGKYILFDDKYHLWEDGVSTCNKCGGPDNLMEK
jgi:Zn finger protein HypA/HybF involved in hydrogenase expression